VARRPFRRRDRADASGGDRLEQRPVRSLRGQPAATAYSGGSAGALGSIGALGVKASCVTVQRLATDGRGTANRVAFETKNPTEN
jgi:hypothetical protein